MKHNWVVSEELIKVDYHHETVVIQPLSTRLIKPNFCNKGRLQNYYLSMLKTRLSETWRIK